MSIFGSIKDAIFGRTAAKPAPAPAAPAPAPPPAAAPQAAQPAPAPPPTAAKPVPKAPVDVDAQLAQIAHDKGDPDLDYKSSIVDLMKLLDLDSSLDNRKALAGELGYTGAKDGSAEMNIWLHKAVMDQLRS